MTHISKKAGLLVATVVVVVLTAAVVLAVGLSDRHSGQSDTSRARDTLTAVPAACDDVRNQIPIAVPGVMQPAKGSNATNPLSEAIALSGRCDDLDRGTDLAGLDQTPFTWNAQCVTDLGGRLRSDRNPTRGDETDILRETNGDINPSKYAQCVTFTATAAECEQYRAAFDALISVSVRQTAILNALGCHNTEVRIPAAG